MSDRYTSHELSRQLAEVGVDQAWTQGRVFWDVDWCLTRASETYVGDGPPWKHVRALDMTDVLEELTRPRPEEKDARPLCVQVRLWHRAAGGGWSSWCEAWDDKGQSVLTDDFIGVHPDWSSIEAAATVLLALLRERAKP